MFLKEKSLVTGKTRGIGRAIHETLHHAAMVLTHATSEEGASAISLGASGV